MESIPHFCFNLHLFSRSEVGHHSWYASVNFVHFPMKFFFNYFCKSSLYNMEISLFLDIKKLSEMNLFFFQRIF